MGRVPSNFGDHGTECIWSSPTSATGCRWAVWEAYGASADLLAEFKRIDRKKSVGKGMGETWIEQ